MDSSPASSLGQPKRCAPTITWNFNEHSAGGYTMDLLLLGQSRAWRRSGARFARCPCNLNLPWDCPLKRSSRDSHLAVCSAGHWHTVCPPPPSRQ